MRNTIATRPAPSPSRFPWPLTVVAAVALAGCGTAACAADAGGKPNIIVIVADDLGYAEVVGSGKQDIPTPRTASLAAAGVFCDNGYVSCPVCSPTRAGLLTGRYQQRFGHEFNPGPAQQADKQFGLPLDQITLANRLKQAGYSTGMVGKWHLGYEPQFRPLKRGFDEFYGFLGGAHSYVDAQADAANRIWRGDEPIDEKTYLTDAFGREAVAYIDRHKAEPFFLYLTFNAVHAPLQAPAKYLDRFSRITDEKRRTFAAMLSSMDDNIGAVLDKLAQEKLDDRTLIFFISDNGGPTRQTTSRNDPLHGFKSQVWEGGIRVPFIVQWKGHLPAGKTYSQPVIALDIVPTAIAAAGLTIDNAHPVDGVDLLPHLSGKNIGQPHESLYWRFGPQWAIRRGDMKLVQPPQEKLQLFDLAHDIGEQHDLASAQPQVVAELQKAYQEWDSQNKAALWKARKAGAGQAGKAAANGKAGKGKAGKGKRNARARARQS